MNQNVKYVCFQIKKKKNNQKTINILLMLVKSKNILMMINYNSKQMDSNANKIMMIKANKMKTKKIS